MHCLRKTRRQDPIGVGMQGRGALSLGVDFDILKAHTRFRLCMPASVSVVQDVIFQPHDCLCLVFCHDDNGSISKSVNALN